MKLSNRFVLAYFFLLITFFITLVFSCLIPPSLLKNNIGISVSTLKKEGTYPSFGLPWRQIVLDNFTDSLMLNTAFSVDSSNPIKSALINIRHDGTVDGANQVLNLEKLYLNKEVKPIGYERYWHGYLTYLRPLLMIFSYSQIRIILTLLLYSSFIIFMFLCWRILGKKVTISLLIGLFFVDFFYLGQSMQFSMVFLIGLLASIFLLYNHKKNHNLYFLFFVIGALTSFFDLLTAPLITLGMLLIVATKLNRANVKNIILYSVSWSIGYLLLWFSKWAIVQFFFAPGAILTAFNQIANRTLSQADSNFSYFSALQLNFFQLIGYSRTNKISVLLFSILYSIFCFRYLSFDKQKIKSILPLVLIGVIPYIWYLIAANHSYLHVWYTYRDQFISVVSLFLITTEFINWKNVKKDFRLIKERFNF